MIKQLTKKELEKLKSVLESFETQTLYETGMKNINGGFAQAEMFDYDNEYIDIELKWGEQDMGDGKSTLNTEQHKINRNTWELEQ